MDKIAAVIITKNEATRIRKALTSVRPLVDEIIVVDDMSTDDTCKIAAEEFGAKVYRRDLNGDFAAQRNFGADQSGCEWIMWMDADEELPVETVSKIRQALAVSKDEVGFQLRRLNHLLGQPIRHAGAYEYVWRIYRSDKVRFQKPIHECLGIQGVTGRIDADILHYPFEAMTPMLMKAVTYGEQEAELYCQQHATVSEKEIRYRLMWKSVKLFWKMYFKKQGFKDGMPGLVWCICNIIGPQIKWIKIWEKAKIKRTLVP
ncbi:MAG: glycosyltransferase family 2 protein [Candidatus Omnitrophica bacterium]|nr:glycosyltransferase family 2 protein [Candidatus Omnitrophota bacterium]